MKRRAVPMRATPLLSRRGFTLLEVLVALVVVALGMSALLETLNESANNVMALRNKTVAEWIAMNQIALARLSLNAPSTGTTQGDVQNCANGNWHWQQQISTVDAVPGLLTIVVSVRRTGTATPNPDQNHPTQPPGATPGATGSLGANVTLGPTAELGTISSLNTAGCASFIAPGSSLGGGSGPGLGSMPSLGASSLGTSSLGSSTSVNPGNSIGAGVANAVSGANAGTNGSGASSDSGNGSAGGNGSGSGTSDNNGWLITVTGFRGTALGPPVGEDPNWSAPGFNANAAANAAPFTPGLGGSATP